MNMIEQDGDEVMEQVFNVPLIIRGEVIEDYSVDYGASKAASSGPPTRWITSTGS